MENQIVDKSFQIRNANLHDIEKILELEKVWDAENRASEAEIKFRLNKFPAGFFIAENSEKDVVASIIACPTHYNPSNINNSHTWEHWVKNGYSDSENSTNHETKNALYILSGTVKPSFLSATLFAEGVNSVVNLASHLGKKYIIAGALIPGYAKYLQNNPHTSAADYVFTKRGFCFVDPLIEKYRRIGFFVPDKNHVIADYYLSDESHNYSAIVVKELKEPLIH